MKKFYNINLKNHNQYGGGFFSNYRICLDYLIRHHDSKIETIPYIDWSSTAFVDGFDINQNPPVPPNSNNPFDHWFDQQIPTDQDEFIQFSNNQPLHSIISHGKNYFDDPVNLNRQQTIDKLYIKPKKYILDQIDEIYNNKFKTNVLLGVIIRSTEYNLYHPEYGCYTIDEYIKKINKILENNSSINKIFIVSEDQYNIDRIHKEFTNSISVEAYRKTTETNEYCSAVLWPNFYNGRSDHRKKLGEETIIQAKLLGKCDYLMGIHSGVFAGSILWNENIKQIFKI